MMKMTRKTLTIAALNLLMAVSATTAYAQQGAKTYGGAGDDYANSIQQTSDGGYIVAGYTQSFGAGFTDFWALKLDASGQVVWQKTYGGGNDEVANSIQQTSDGGYIVAGWTRSFGAGGPDLWALKLDASGQVVWQKTYGGGNDEVANSIQQTSDGGYIVAGLSGSSDFWVLKLDASGQVLWQKTYGGGGLDYAYSIQQTSDGGYIVAARTFSFGAGNWDVWALKLDASGQVLWQKTYGGGDLDEARSIQQTSDGGYIVAGSTFSSGAGQADFWVLKLDGNGNVVWQKTYGGGDLDYGYSIQQTSDGGYIAAGWTRSFGAGGFDFWVLKLDGNGDIPGCSAVLTSTSTSQDSSVTPADSSATPGDTAVSGTDSSASTGDTTVTAGVVCESAPTYTLTITGAGTGSGSVTGTGIQCNLSAGIPSGDCSEAYAAGANVNLSATPLTGSSFVGWSGACSGTANTTSVTMDANKTCTATFNLIPPPTLTLTIGPNSPGQGTAYTRGQTNRAMLQFVATAGSSEAVRLTTLTVRAGGSGNDQTGVTSVKVWLDANGNGQVDGGDTQVGSGTYNADNAVLTLALSPAQVIPAGGSRTYLVTYDLAP
jgi:hypothetical protein